MAESRLRTGVLGLGQAGKALIEAAQQTGHFDIRAVAEADGQAAAGVAEACGCKSYDDYRQLIVQNQLDALLVAAPTHRCIEHIRTAIKKGFNIFKLPPVARNLEEATDLVRTAARRQVNFWVASEQRFSPGPLRLRKIVQDGHSDEFHLVTGLCFCAGPAEEPWRRDRQTAGGGVLLYGGYEQLDLLVSCFSLPQQVYALNLSRATDAKQRKYLCEDTAVVSMRFREGLAGNIVVSSGFAPTGWSVKLYGKDRVYKLNSQRLDEYSPAGELVEQFEVARSSEQLLADMLAGFAQSVGGDQMSGPSGSGGEHLGVMALIEAAYLSARTAMPEQPARAAEIVST